tara:strand:- start:4007 stop:4201 length:195 start_codon:yes stop_codon:yes gene_type:complete
MTRDQIEQLIKIRKVLITGHGDLDGRGGSVDVAMIKQKDVAAIYEDAIKRVDNLLKGEGVGFQK